MTLFAPPGELAQCTLGAPFAIAPSNNSSSPRPTFDSVTDDHAHGYVELDGRRLALSIELASKRVRAVTVRYDPPFSVDDDPQAQAEAVFDEWAEALASHFGAKPTKKQKRRVEIALRKPYAAHVTLAHHVARGEDGEPVHSVTLSKSLDASVRLAVDASELWFDAESIAALLVSKKFDAKAVAQRAVEHFASGPTFSHSADWQRVVFDARAASAKRAPAVFEALLAALSWADLDRARWFFSYTCPSSAQDPYAAKRFNSTPIHTIVAIIERLAPPAEQRAQLAVTIVRALERGDDEALRSLGTQLAARPGATPPFNTPEGVSDRLFAALTWGQSELERAGYCVRAASSADDLVAACVRSFGQTAPSLPVLATIEDARERANAERWATFWLLVRERFGAEFDALLDEFARRPSLWNRTTIPAIAAAVGEQESKSVYRIGRLRFTVRGAQCSVG